MASVRSERVVNAQSGTSLFKLACIFQFHFAVLCVQHSAFAEGIVHAKLIAFMAFVASGGIGGAGNGGDIGGGGSDEWL
jgi:hypothetical protein